MDAAIVVDGSAAPWPLRYYALPNRNAISKVPRAAGYRVAISSIGTEQKVLKPLACMPGILGEADNVSTSQEILRTIALDPTPTKLLNGGRC